MTNKRNTVLYTGVTSDLPHRVDEHKDKAHPNSFTAKYNINKLIYYELFHSIEEAILREKQIKKYRREKKVNLIDKMNPSWDDLYHKLENY